MVKNTPPVKSKAMRVQEAVTILTKLQEIGISKNDIGYQQTKQYLDTWIADGESCSATFEFPRHGRKAELLLPKRIDRPASLALRTVATSDSQDSSHDSSSRV